MWVTGSALSRRRIEEKEVTRALTDKRTKQKEYYDKGAKPLSKLTIGDKVMFRKRLDAWEYGCVVKIVSDRSYIVQDSDRNYFRRNRKLIRKIGANKSDYANIDDGDEVMEQGENEHDESFHSVNDDGNLQEELDLEGEISTPEVQTRSGRTIRPPENLRDYEVY